ncbi:TPA: MFS transporter [Burkholderia cenocepacia]|nr:MFS transporter [Burkholderia cenocepacia]
MIRSRWVVLTIMCLCVFQNTLNWFCLAPAFSPIIRELHLTTGQMGNLVAAFVAGYGVFHLPGGLLSARLGMRLTLLLGIVVEGLASLGCYFATTYDWLIVCRFIGGVGGAACFGSAIGIVSAWFRGRELALASGILTGLSFTLGATAGLSLWSPIIDALGWRLATGLAGLIGLGVAVVAGLIPLIPPAHQQALSGNHLNRATLMRILGNRTIWMWGLCSFGVYGSSITAMQFVALWSTQTLHLSPGQSNLTAALFALSPIPAAIVGGWIADRYGNLRVLIPGSFALSGILYLLLPLATSHTVYAAVVAVSFVYSAGLTPWFALPAMYPERVKLADIPAASGLMLSLAAIGGIIVPVIFGKLTNSNGFSSGWQFLGISSIIFSLAGLAAGSPDRASRTAETSMLTSK